MPTSAGGLSNKRTSDGFTQAESIEILYGEKMQGRSIMINVIINDISVGCNITLQVFCCVLFLPLVGVSSASPSLRILQKIRQLFFPFKRNDCL